jgi:Holliday junction DNA helicase RuvA
MAIATLRGRVLFGDDEKLIVEAFGVGYEVLVSSKSSTLLRDNSGEAFLYIVSVSGMYGGGETLYGFLNAQEKEMFLLFKENIPGAGAKKALEYMEKASKSFPDFRRAIIEKDATMLSAVFGFTAKTVDKLIASLKDKIQLVAVSGSEKLRRTQLIKDGSFAQVLSALSALGYKNAEARSALQAVVDENTSAELRAEEIVRLALKKL